jgi:hypothetical protein
VKRRNEVVVDARGRISLNFRTHKETKRYLAEEQPDGTITLTPAVVVPAYLLKPMPSRDDIMSINEIRERL